MIIRHPKKSIDRDLMALAVNLALEPRCAELICADGDTVHALIKRAHQTYDPLLLKFIRNLVTHQGPSLDLFKVKFIKNSKFK